MATPIIVACAIIYANLSDSKTLITIYLVSRYCFPYVYLPTLCVQISQYSKHSLKYRQNTFMTKARLIIKQLS